MHHGFDQSIGEPHGYPHGGEQEDAGDAGIHDGECYLNALPGVQKLIEFDLAFPRLGKLAQHLGVDLAVDVEIAVIKVLQLEECSDDAGVAGVDDDEFTLAGRFEHRIRGRLELHLLVGSDAHIQHLAIPVHKKGCRQATQQGVRGQSLDESGSILVEQFALLAQVSRNLSHGLARHLTMFSDIGFRHCDRCIHNGAGAFGKPRIKAPVQRYGGENSNDDGRKHRNKAKQPNHADMQARTRDAPPTCREKPQHLPADKACHDRNEDEIGDQQCQHKRLGGLDGGKPGQDDIGCQPAKDGGHNDCHGAYGAEPVAEVKTSAPRAALRFLNGV